MADQTFSVFMPFDKVEDQPDGTLMAFGRATQEVRDSAGEIMDYASSAPLFQRRSQETMDRSGGNNAFPLRAMHQPIAAGKVTQFDYRPDEKAIDIAAHVVDPTEISKVKNHVYTGFSVGGKYAKRWPDSDGRSMRYTADPREISLVDAPAVPTAKLTLFKFDDDVPDEAPAWVDEFNKSVQTLAEIRKADQDERDQALSKQKALGERVGIAYREGSPLTTPKDLPADPAEYADPANWAFLVNQDGLTKVIGQFNGGNGEDQYSPRERHILGRRVTQLANRFGNQYAYDPKIKKINRKVEKAMSDTNVEKLDVGKLVAQLKAAHATAADLMQKNPQDALSYIMGQLDDLSSPVGDGQTAPVTDPDVAIKAAMPPSSTETPSSAATEAKPAAKAAEPAPSTTTSTPSSAATEAKPAAKAAAPTATTPDSDNGKTSPSDTATTPVKKDAEIESLKAQIADMAGAMNKLIEGLNKQAPIVAKSDDGNGPVGALNALLDKNTIGALEGLTETESRIVKMLDEGGPYTLIKCLQIAAGEGNVIGPEAYQMYNNTVRKATYIDLEKSGIVTSSAHQMKLLNPQ